MSNQQQQLQPWHIFSGVFVAFWAIMSYFDNFFITLILCVGAGFATDNLNKYMKGIGKDDELDELCPPDKPLPPEPPMPESDDEEFNEEPVIMETVEPIRAAPKAATPTPPPSPVDQEPIKEPSPEPSPEPIFEVEPLVKPRTPSPEPILKVEVPVKARTPSPEPVVEMKAKTPTPPPSPVDVEPPTPKDVDEKSDDILDTKFEFDTQTTLETEETSEEPGAMEEDLLQQATTTESKSDDLSDILAASEESKKDPILDFTNEKSAEKNDAILDLVMDNIPAMEPDLVQHVASTTLEEHDQELANLLREAQRDSSPSLAAKSDLDEELQGVVTREKDEGDPWVLDESGAPESLVHLDDMSPHKEQLVHLDSDELANKDDISHCAVFGDDVEQDELDLDDEEKRPRGQSLDSTSSSSVGPDDEPVEVVKKRQNSSSSSSSEEAADQDAEKKDSLDEDDDDLLGRPKQPPVPKPEEAAAKVDETLSGLKESANLVDFS